ncbi:dUTPase-like protein [Spinellus fusiger]|nr:dUTPase-like protein [Spinellus fusiger]
MTELLVKRLSKFAQLPTRGSPHAAGYDLYSAANITVPAQNKAIVPTDIAICMPKGCYGRVAPRSGLSVNHFIDTGAGVIDSDYRGPVGVVLFNFSTEDFKISIGDRIAQLILERIYTPDVVEVESLSLTAREGCGFGSTGRR